MSIQINNRTLFELAFEKNKAIRACSYDPAANFEYVQDPYGVTKVYLAAQYKNLWFHTYCTETGKSGHIESDDYSIMIFEAFGTGLVAAKARVYINGEMAGSGSSGAAFKLNNEDHSMDGAIQTATGGAQSRALSNAGFGAISSYEIFEPQKPNGTDLPYEFPEDPAIVGNGNPNPAGAYANSGAPAVAPRNPMPGTGNGIKASDNASTVSAGPNQQMAFFGNTAPAPAADPVEAAKNVIWPRSGHYSGKTLGELLAECPNQIIFIAEK